MRYHPGVPNVLIRDVDPADLEAMRSAAAAQGTSLQVLLRDAVHARAAHLRRRAALDEIAADLRGRPVVPDGERQAVLDAVEEEEADRAGQLADPSAR